MGEKVLTVKQLKDMLSKYPDEAKVFINGRTEFLDSDIKNVYIDVKLYPEGYYGVDNGDGCGGKSFKALVLEL